MHGKKPTLISYIFLYASIDKERATFYGGNCRLRSTWENCLSTAPLQLTALFRHFCITDLFQVFSQIGTLVSYRIFLKTPLSQDTP